jgi:hypothetical protein
VNTMVCKLTIPAQMALVKRKELSAAIACLALHIRDKRAAPSTAKSTKKAGLKQRSNASAVKLTQEERSRAYV